MVLGIDGSQCNTITKGGAQFKMEANFEIDNIGHMMKLTKLSSWLPRKALACIGIIEYRDPMVWFSPD